jgi:acetyl esterase
VTLSAQCRAVLDQLTSAGIPHVRSLTPARAREVAAQRRALNPPRAEPVAQVEDRQIPGVDRAGNIPIRIYRPGLSAEPIAVEVYFHGGGWVVGDLDSHDAICRAVANRAGCVVVSVDYRLAPESPYPAALEDAYAATRWVADHAASIGADPYRLAVGGDSAGGNLATAVCLLARERGGPAIALQILVYPVIDGGCATGSYEEFAQDFSLERDDMLWYWDQYLGDQDRLQPLVSPLRATDLGGLPPALIITAGYDPLRDEGEAYAQRLREAGVPTTLTRYDGVIHGFLGMLGVVDESQQAIEQVAHALRTRLAAPVPARS